MWRYGLDIFDFLFLFYKWWAEALFITFGAWSYTQALLLLVYSYTLNSLLLILDKLTIYSWLTLVSSFAVVFALKFILLIALLIFVRGGIPRYRYDFLTKLGWVKTLSLILVLFLIVLLLAYLN